jgi:hypothetical protein
MLVWPAGQRTWRTFQSMVKALLSKPSAARAWGEWFSRTGVTVVIPCLRAAVIRSAEG